MSYAEFLEAKTRSAPAVGVDVDRGAIHELLHPWQREATAWVAEAERQRKLAEAADERRREVAAMSDDELAEVLLSTGDSDDTTARRRLAGDELRDRQAARRREAEVAEAHRALQVPAQADSTLRAASGSVSTRKVWKAEVVDATLVPHSYLTVDMKKVNAAVRAGRREIPGVRIWQDDELAVSAR